MYKISLIIPVYNAEKYLKDLLESIINQTIDYRNIEVIMIDDNSTDNSVDIIDEYVEKYNNFSAIKLQINNFVAGKARNEGIKIATGKYLMFADADDFLTLDACKLMYEAMEEKKADVINANYINADEDKKLWDKPIFDKQRYKNFKLSITDYKDSFFVYNSSACNKIFRRDFIIQNEIRFLEEVPAEDAYFTACCLLKTDKIYYINDIMYCYRQRNKSANSRSVSFNCSRDYFKKINIAYKKIYELYKVNNQLKFYRFVYAKNMSYMLYKFIDSTLLTKEERISILVEMKWFYELSKKLKVPACQRSQGMIIENIIKNNYEEAIKYCNLVQEMRSYMTNEIRETMSRPTSDMYQDIAIYNNEF